MSDIHQSLRLEIMPLTSTGFYFTLGGEEPQNYSVWALLSINNWFLLSFNVFEDTRIVEKASNPEAVLKLILDRLEWLGI